MAKRLTASDKWDDPWFCELDSNYKLAWLYLLDKCNHAGIWSPNLKLMEFHLGFQPRIDGFGGKVVALKDGKWFIPKFIDFQYGELNPENRAHLSVIHILAKEGASKPLKSPLQGDKDKDKDSSSSKGGSGGFELFWKEYPKKIGKGAAEKSWAKIKPLNGLVEDIIRAVISQKRSDQWTKDGGQYIPHPSTWLNGQRWLDEISPNGPKKEAPAWDKRDQVIQGQAKLKPE